MDLNYINTILQPKYKANVLEPNADGYYSVVLGALNYANNLGHYYVLNDDVAKLFSSSSELLYKVNNRRMFPEDNHPKWPTGMTEDEYKRLLLEDDTDRIVGHIRRVWLDSELTEKQLQMDGVNDNTVLIMGEVTPFGARKQVLQDALTNPHQDVCFSLRGFSDDYMVKGVRHKYIKHILKWDYVPAPGLDIASKVANPTATALESRSSNLTWKSDDFRAILDTLDIDDNSKQDQLALESRRREIASLMVAFEKEDGIREEVRSNLKMPTETFNW